MFKKLVTYGLVLSLCVLVASAPQPQQSKTVQVLKNVKQSSEDGTWETLYELNNGSFAASTGALKEINGGDGPSKVAISVGVFNYVGSDGQTYWVKWTVDENGFSPEIGSAPPKELQKVVDEAGSDNLIES